MDPAVEVCQIWPEKRDPAVPFFVYETGADRIFLFKPKIERYIAAGTFPDGTPCVLAIPKNVKDKAWLCWTNQQQAEETVKHLNRLHKQGLIDWSGNRPKIKTASAN